MHSAGGSLVWGVIFRGNYLGDDSNKFMKVVLRSSKQAGNEINY